MVDLGLAAHDLARHLDGPELLRRAEALNIPPCDVERRLPVLLHGHVAAAELEDDGLMDPRVLESVRWHTTGRRGMGDVAKVVFLADKLDPQKARRYPFLPEIEDLARDSLDAALLRFLDLSTADHLATRSTHPPRVHRAPQRAAACGLRAHRECSRDFPQVTGQSGRQSPLPALGEG